MPLPARIALPALGAGAALLVFAWLGLPPAEPAGAAPAPPVSRTTLLALGAGTDSLARALDDLSAALARSEIAASAPESFRRARSAYKRIEFLIAFLDPLVSGWLNGPPAEDEDDIPRPPGVMGGFQVVEAALFPELVPGGLDTARIVLTEMRRGLADFQGRLTRLPLHEPEVLDAARLEIARISTLGLAGFDSDGSGGGVLEAADAFEGMRAFLAGLPEADPAIGPTMARAALYLRLHPDFERLNRLEFLAGYAGPAARAVAAARARWPAPGPRRGRSWRPEAATVFDTGAFDARAFASFDAPASTPALVRLGERLFAEARLSGPGTRSCRTCHDPARAFTDGRVRSPLLGRGLTRRNTPTLWNAAYQPVLFQDQRAASLEAQVDSVLANPEEMASSTELAAWRLRDDSVWRARFARVFAGRSEASVTAGAIRLALAAYVRSLTGLNSRFDRAVRGDTLALSPLERAGLTVFLGKGRCGSCHFLPFFNGTAPPRFASSEGEIIGVPDRPVTRAGRLDPDSGRGGSDHLPEHLFAFRVPTLRNITLTAPYMHNGVYRDLEQVVDFYDRGGGSGIGAVVPGQTLPPRKLGLTPYDRGALIAFLGALTDTTGTY